MEAIAYRHVCHCWMAKSASDATSKSKTPGNRGSYLARCNQQGPALLTPLTVVWLSLVKTPFTLHVLLPATGSKVYV